MADRIQRSGRKQWDLEEAGRGSIKVVAEAGQGALPLPGVEVWVRKQVGERLCLLGQGYTDSDGMIVFSGLPAMPGFTSSVPGPYAGMIYSVSVDDPRLGRISRSTAVFDGVVSLVRFSGDPLPVL